MTDMRAQSEARIAEIEARVKNATGGDWTIVRPGHDPQSGFPTGVVIACVARSQCIYSDPPGGSFPESDRKFIVHARGDIPWLLAELRSAQAASAALGAEVERLREALKGAIANLTHTSINPEAFQCESDDPDYLSAKAAWESDLARFRAALSPASEGTKPNG